MIFFMKNIWFAFSPRALAEQEAAMVASSKRNTASPMSCTLRQQACVDEEESNLYTGLYGANIVWIKGNVAHGDCKELILRLNQPLLA